MSKSSINSDYDAFENKIRKMIDTKIDASKKIHDLVNDRNGVGSQGSFQINNMGSQNNIALFGTGTGNIVGE